MIKFNKKNKQPTGVTQFVPQQLTIFLEQSSGWSRAILWTVMGATAFGITWACLAEIDKVIPTRGSLEPQGEVKEVKAPISGVVEKVFVKDGTEVQANQALLQFDQQATLDQLKSLEQIRQSVSQENQFYRSQIGSLATDLNNKLVAKLPAEMLILLKNRAGIVAENQLYELILSGSNATLNLTGEQKLRLQAKQNELSSKAASSRIEIEKIQQYQQQLKIKLANAKNRLSTEQQILENIRPLSEDGGYPKNQYLKQKQAVETSLAEVNQLQQELDGTQSTISQAQAQLTNTIATSATELQDKIAANQQRIAEIDSQLGKVIVENEKKMSESDSQISQIQQNLKYTKLTAPGSGKVFELKAFPGFVAQASQTILEIVPNDNLIARVYIPSKDRGFVTEGMEVEVRVDSFDFSEFGDVKGKLISIGADALDADQTYPYQRYPAKIQLEKQSINVKGEPVSLKPGMSVTANIKERKRKVISVVIGHLSEMWDTLEKGK